MEHTLPKCDGTFYCKFGVCWHCDARRLAERAAMIDTSKARLCDRMAYFALQESAVATKPRKPTKQERRYMEALREAEEKRIAAARRAWAARHPGYVFDDDDTIHPIGYPCGVGCDGYPDKDGVGSWGLAVRIYEDAGDFMDTRENWSNA